MIISVVYNEKKDNGGKIISSIKKAFDGKAELKIFTNKITSVDLEGSDMVMALGGDGTIIRASKAAAVYGIPVCGVNLGRIGFLAAVEPEEIEIAAKRLVGGDYLIEERMMLETEFDINGEKKKMFALNDIVLSRGSCHKMIDISIDMAEEHLDDFRADGVVVSTPTGSTAYSLSAGGPIVAPQLEVFLVTPVCASDLHIRSLVLTADNTLTLSASGKKGAFLEVDGLEVAQLEPAQKIYVNRSMIKAKIVKMSEKSFLKTLRKKFCR